jgi:hypothetical protein
MLTISLGTNGFRSVFSSRSALSAFAASPSVRKTRTGTSHQPSDRTAALVDQLFNASDKRLARTLPLLASYGKPEGPRRVLPRIFHNALLSVVLHDGQTSDR